MEAEFIQHDASLIHILNLSCFPFRFIEPYIGLN